MTNDSGWTQEEFDTLKAAADYESDLEGWQRRTEWAERRLAERDAKLDEVKKVCANAVALSSSPATKYTWLIGHLTKILLDTPEGGDQ